MRRLADPDLPANIGHRRPTVGLPQGVGNLFFGELGALHGSFLTGAEDHKANLLKI